MTSHPLPDAASPQTTAASGSPTPAARRPTMPTLGNEREFERTVVDVAHLYGWKAAHFRPARTVHGWRTAVAYDGAGFPDLALVHPIRGLHWYRELKVGNAKLSDEQSAWQGWLISAGANFDIWRPRDFDDIVAALSGGKARPS